MRLGISSYTYNWAIGVRGFPAPMEPLSAAGLLDRALELGVHVVQICDNLPLDALSEGALESLVRTARERRIDLETGTRGIEHAHLTTYLRLAERLGSPILRVVVDKDEDRPSPEEVVARLKPIISQFEEAGVTLAIENHDRFPVARLAEILERLGSSHVGICLDTANSFGCLENLETVVRVLGPWTVNLHVKEFSIARLRHNFGFVIEGRPAGQGMVDVAWLLSELRGMGRDPNAIIELWTPPEEEIADSVAKEAAWAAESVRFLRQFIPE